MPLSVPEAAIAGREFGTVEVVHQAFGASGLPGTNLVTWNNLDSFAQQWFAIEGIGNVILRALVPATYQFHFFLIRTFQEPAANVNFPLDPFGTTHFWGITGIRRNGVLIIQLPVGTSREIPHDDGAGNWTIGNHHNILTPFVNAGDTIEVFYNTNCYNAITNTPYSLAAYRCLLYQQTF